MAPEDQGTWGGGRGGHRRAGPGGRKSHLLRALGSHRGWCPGEGQSCRAGRGAQRAAPGPRPDSSPTPSSCWEPRQEPGARLPTFTKEIWAMGAPGWVFRSRNPVSPHQPDPVAAESGARGGGTGGPNHSAFQQQRGQEARLLKPGPARGTSAPATGPQHPLCPSAQEGTHLGLGTPRPGAGQAGRVRARPDPLLRHRAGAGSGRGTFLRWRGTGIRLPGRRAGGGEGRPTQQREQRERRLRAANARHTQPAGTPRGSALRGHLQA